MYKLAIFDLDGTLANTIESMATAGNKTLMECGLQPRDTREYNYFVGNGADMLIRRALTAAGDSENIHFEKAKQVYDRFFEEGCTYNVSLYDGIKDMLDSLKERGIKVAILTNKDHERALRVAHKLFEREREGYIDRVIGHQPSIKIKPDPEGALLIAKEFGIKPSECIYVGDTNVDMKTGKAANMFTIGVLWGFRTKEELEENQADLIVSHPSKITELFQG